MAISKQEYKDTLALAQWVKMEFPDLVYRVDMVDFARLPKRTASNLPLLQKGRGYPDWFFASPGGLVNYSYNGGMYVEYKSDPIESFYKKDQETLLAQGKRHLLEQAIYLEKLAGDGYFTTFCFEIEDFQRTVKNYMAGFAGREAKTRTFIDRLMAATIEEMVQLGVHPELLNWAEELRENENHRW